MRFVKVIDLSLSSATYQLLGYEEEYICICVLGGGENVFIMDLDKKQS